MTPSPPRTFLFDSTNAALWAEEVVRGAGIPVEVVPAPADSDARCDLALVTTEAHADRLSATLVGEGVPFRLWRGG